MSHEPQFDRILQRMWADFDRGTLRSVDEYVAAAPDCAEQIREEYRGMFTDVDEGTGGEDESTDKQNVVGNYKIIRELKRGGMGRVYLAWERRLDRYVVLKTIDVGILDDRSEVESRLRRLEKEAHVGGRLNHASLCPVLAVVQHKDLLWVVMPFYDGESLSDHIVKERTAQETQVSGSRSWIALDGDRDSIRTMTNANVARSSTRTRRTSFLPQVLRFVEKVARAVQVAHEAGVVHRDLTPNNILVLRHGMPMVLDFGLAIMTDQPHRSTRNGELRGTPNYMSPEQARGEVEAIGPATDIFALGAILYELIALRRAFDGGDVNAVIRKVIECRPTSLRRINPKVPADLEAVCQKALEHDPQRRYRTASEFADDLARLCELRPTRARPISGVGKLWRWIQREPRTAALVLLMILLAMSSVTLWRKWRFEAEERARAVALEEAVDLSTQAFDVLLVGKLGIISEESAVMEHSSFRVMRTANGRRSDTNRATELFESAHRLSPRHLVSALGLILAYDLGDRNADALSALEQLTRSNAVDAASLERIRAYLGDHSVVENEAPGVDPVLDALLCVVEASRTPDFARTKVLGARATKLLKVGAITSDQESLLVATLTVIAASQAIDQESFEAGAAALRILRPEWKVGRLLEMNARQRLAAGQSDSEFEKVVVGFEDMLDEEPDRLDLRVRLIDLLLRRGRTSRAIACAEDGVDAMPDHIGANLILLNVHFKQKDWPSVESIAERLIRRFGPSASLLFALGLSEEYQGKLTEALEHYDAAVASDPAVPSLMHSRGMVRTRLLMNDGAAEDLERVWNDDEWLEASEFLEARKQLYFSYYDSGRYAELVLMAPLLESFPPEVDNQVQMLRLYAGHHLLLKRWLETEGSIPFGRLNDCGLLVAMRVLGDAEEWTGIAEAAGWINTALNSQNDDTRGLVKGRIDTLHHGIVAIANAALKGPSNLRPELSPILAALVRRWIEITAPERMTTKVERAERVARLNRLVALASIPSFAAHDAGRSAEENETWSRLAQELEAARNDWSPMTRSDK